MTRHRRILALLLCAVMLFGMFGCSKEPAATEAPTAAPTAPPPTEPPAEALYVQAADLLEAASGMELNLTTTKTITIGTETFKEVSTQVVTLAGIGTDALKATLSDTFVIDDYYEEYDEYFEGGILYTAVDASRFQGSMTQEEFLSRFAPAILLDETLYGEITSEEVVRGTLITFSAPTAAETWALPEGAEFISAEGSALIGEDGTLSRSIYAIEYVENTFPVKLEVKAEAVANNAIEVKAPADLTAYQEVTSIDAIRVAENALLRLYASTTVSTTINETIVSQAAAYTQTEQTVLHYSGLGNTHAADMDYTITIFQNGASDTYTQNEHFEDGQYSTSSSDAPSEIDDSINAASMQNYERNIASENLLAEDRFQNMTIEEIGGLLYLELDPTDEFGEDMNHYICSRIFGNEELLNREASAYRTDTTTYNLTVDPATGFPLSVGIVYSGTHTIDGKDYTLALETAQTFQLANEATLEAITGEASAAAEPEEAATPLLYHVTGAEGQEMWLMGTIHVGDARTAYLPDAVYAALDSSDALAVECDTVAFEEKAATDADLAAQMAALYINADNTPTKDLLDEEVYNKAIKLLKASGSYAITTELMKPFFWSQAIDNFYIGLPYGLSSDRGVDVQLMERAKEKGIELREIESVMFQLEMLSNYSTELQILLLEMSLEPTAAEVCAETRNMYELWCRGDEAALRELLNEEASDLTEEEMKLYEEYTKAMLTDRNDGMLKVAIEYLESGDTVFYAVGLAHLLQGNGLVDALRAAGYTVEAITYA
ncbi:MAG: TraB/GumN family protein [Oscillospiraceae bacterium]|nr:TraB/GumN family protein [Oscillospiraceae bacterium]